MNFNVSPIIPAVSLANDFTFSFWLSDKSEYFFVPASSNTFATSLAFATTLSASSSVTLLSARYLSTLTLFAEEKPYGFPISYNLSANSELLVAFTTLLFFFFTILIITFMFF